MVNKDKEVYNSIVCVKCVNRNVCDKNKFKVYVVGRKNYNEMFVL